ncbi:competence type IV pilus major pilin ComGC [Desulfuribacillus alkaliarsenatis]|uniref:Prepilin-type N-terminal cleavage/methylation domain-containing protein n=1 Tax=Desulfuribacillus alkaliarsenatis TaxID=766136 RepID=A0A1E5G5N2_9FIRM|nr:prepilin-type N-terminal cleavage/methylation domain-containing protein [Desulfuribacillus alkaliarsenatis]OEF98405.1 hypothetical protein BHF68_01630 [Desulfuribacillus alkaliarsenatis]
MGGIKNMKVKKKKFKKTIEERKKLSTNQTGFTLIELMIAITIIVIVMAIAIPNFQKAGETAQISGCDGNKKIIMAQLENYFMINGQYPLLENIDGENGIKLFYDDFDIDEQLANGNWFHGAYQELAANDKEDWHAVNLLEMKEEGFLQQIAICPRGGFYLIKLGDNNRVTDIMCSVLN